MDENQTGSNKSTNDDNDHEQQYNKKSANTVAISIDSKQNDWMRAAAAATAAHEQTNKHIYIISNNQVNQ